MPKENMNHQNDYPYLFDSKACKTCGGKCCRGQEGYVWLSIKEMEKMAASKKMSVGAFAKQFVRRVQGKFSLRERVINGEHICCFLDPIEGKCTVYDSRPGQCRTFPFWDKFRADTQALILECPGISLKEGNE